MSFGPLISAAEAISLLGQAVFLDARAGADALGAFAAGHVSGAIHADLERDLSEPGDPSQGGRHPLPSLQRWRQRLGEWGVTRSTPVIVYDAAGGGMAAARAWWMLRAVGHAPVAVVDGGWASLRDADAPSETKPPLVRMVGPYPASVERWPILDADEVEGLRQDARWRLIDARASARYAGRTEPLDPVAGHIPGAQSLYWQSQLDEDGAFVSIADLRARYSQVLDGVPPERVVCYCGSGVTACHLLLAMDACGLGGAQLYLGSWSEWCRQDRPRAAQ